MTTQTFARVGRGIVTGFPRPVSRAVHSIAAMLLAASLATCNAIGLTGGGGRNSLTVSPSALTVAQGRSGTVTITLSRSTRSNGAVSLGFTADAPPGTTLTFDPPSLSGSTVSSTLTVATSLTSFPQTITPFVRAISTDGDTAIAQLSLTIAVLPPVTIQKAGTGAGTVSSSPAGIDCGTSCSKQFATDVTLTAAPAAGSTFAGWSIWSGGVCNNAALTCTFTPRATLNNQVLATFNSTAPSFTFALSPSTVTVQQGSNSAVTISLTRVNGFADPVALSASGLPSGITIAPMPTSVGGSTATLTVAAAASVVVGNYPVTITATGPGVAQQTATLVIQVTPAQIGNGNIVLSVASCDPSEVPIWAAAQNGTGAWTRIALVNNTFTFTIGTSGGFALVQRAGAGLHTSVFYGSSDEFSSIAGGSLCGGLNTSTGTKRLTGTTANAGDTAASATISIGGASTSHPTIQGPAYTLDSVSAGLRDLIAARVRPNANGVPAVQKLILRRNINYSASIPVLDFGSAESFNPAAQGIVPVNFGADQLYATGSFVTAANGPTAPYLNRPVGAAAATNGGFGYAGVPDSLLQPGDLHALTLTATPANGSSFRVAMLLQHSIMADTTDSVTFGPTLNQPTVTSLATSPYLRLHAQLTSQSGYSGAARAGYSQPANSVGVTVTAAYAGGTPPNWTIDIPDLTGAGYDPAWALKSGTSVDWQVIAVGGSFLALMGATPVDGARMVGAGVSSTSSSFNRVAWISWIRPWW
jgi:hypothetical protein